jgi:uncharacterized membrane protein YdbT with pleckstrin-like domain
MPGVEYDTDEARPRSRSQWYLIAGLVAVVLLVMTRGVVSLLVLGLVALIVGLVVGFAYTAVKAVRGKVPESATG